MTDNKEDIIKKIKSNELLIEMFKSLIEVCDLYKSRTIKLSYTNQEKIKEAIDFFKQDKAQFGEVSYKRLNQSFGENFEYSLKNVKKVLKKFQKKKKVKIDKLKQAQKFFKFLQNLLEIRNENLINKHKIKI